MADRAVMDVFLDSRRLGNVMNKGYVEKADLHRYIYAQEGASQHV
jgi:hypothetical protein